MRRKTRCVSLKCRRSGSWDGNYLNRYRYGHYTTSAIGHTSDHERREQALKGARKYEHIYKNYAVLKRASTNARYLSECDVFDDYMSPDRVIEILLKHHLHQVELSAKRYLSSEGAGMLLDILALFR